MSSILLLNQEICEPDGTVLVTPSTTAILAAFMPDGTVQDIAVGALASQPGVLCGTGLALTMVITDSDSSITSAQIRVIGADCFDRALDETCETNTPGSATYTMVKPFYRIDTLKVTGVDFTGADLLSIGVSGVLGLPVIISSASEVRVARVDGGVEAVPTIVAADNTWEPASAPNSARRFYVNIFGD